MHYTPAPMHVPDGFLSTFVSIILWVASVIAVGFSLKRVSQDIGERQVPLMGVLAAAIFAGQMLNFAVAGGSSGHLMGAAIATILLGPWAAVLVMTSVVSIQALIFQDGGLLALGANIFNMAVIGVAVSYVVYQAVYRLSGKRPWGIFVGGFLAAWFSIEIAALGVGLQLAVSGTSPANIAIPAMAAIHAIIGIGEGLITTGVLAFVYATRPDLITRQEGRTSKVAVVWIAGLVAALALAILSPLASSNPDGLEWVSEQEGFVDSAQSAVYNIIPDYVLPGVSNKALATILAGILGVILVFGVAIGIAYLRRRQQPSDQ